MKLLGLGLFFNLIASIALYTAKDLAVGVSAEPGPGLFPIMVGALLWTIGLLLTIKSIRT